MHPRCATLRSATKRTWCPIKGHADYLDLVSNEGHIDAAQIAWRYEDALEMAAALKDRVAFDASRVLIEEHPSAGTE